MNVCPVFSPPGSPIFSNRPSVDTRAVANNATGPAAIQTLPGRPLRHPRGHGSFHTDTLRVTGHILSLKYIKGLDPATPARVPVHVVASLFDPPPSLPAVSPLLPLRLCNPGEMWAQER